MSSSSQGSPLKEKIMKSGKYYELSKKKRFKGEVAVITMVPFILEAIIRAYWE